MAIRKIYILFILFLVICARGGVRAQSIDMSQLEAMRHQVDSLDGYPKAQMLLSLASQYSNLSITTSMQYCEELRKCIHELAPKNSFDPQIDLYDNPDSILDLRANLYFLLGKCYYSLDEVTDSDSILMSAAVIANKQRALNNFEIFLKIRQHQGDELNIAEAYNALAVAMSSLGKTDSALIYYKNNLNIYQKLNNKLGMSKTYNNIAVFYQQDSIEQAIRYYRIAMRYAMEDSVMDGLAYLSPTINLADLYVQKGNYTMATKLLYDAIPICRRDHNFVVLKAVYLELANIYNNQGNYKEAYDYMTKYVAIKDTLVDIETMQHINELAVKYETARRELQIAELTKQRQDNEIQMELDRQTLKVQRFWVIVATVIMVIALVAFAWAFRENARKRKSNNLLIKANESINMSLSYASRLQRIIIRGNNPASDILKDFFVIYQPKNIVSGDFYYVRDFNDFRVVAVSDCTGHGVPAAFLSVLNITFFNEIFTVADDVPDPGVVLNEVRTKVIHALNQTSDFYSSTDGMDCALVVVDKNSRIVRYAGAYIDLWILRKSTKKIEKVKSTHNPVSWYFKNEAFVSTQISLESDDIIYMFSDGYPDQVEPVNTEKYTKVRMRRDLEQMVKDDLPTQKERLLENIKLWQGSADQIDDILVLGIRASSLFD